MLIINSNHHHYARIRAQTAQMKTWQNSISASLRDPLGPYCYALLTSPFLALCLCLSLAQ